MQLRQQGMHQGRDQFHSVQTLGWVGGTCWGPSLSAGKSQVSGLPAGVPRVALALGGSLLPARSPNCCVTLGDSRDCAGPGCEMRTLRPKRKDWMKQ